MYVLPYLSVVTMGYHVTLYVCFGDQLAGFMILGTYAWGLGHVLDSPVETLGHSLKYFVLVG